MPVERDKLMEKARANLCYVEARRYGSVQTQAKFEMAAFLDFMHPDMPEEQKSELIRNAGVE